MSGTGPRLNREQSLASRPVRLPCVGTTERGNGGLLVRCRVARSGWQRWLGAGEAMERSFGLDRLGRWVYERCDGNTTVRQLVDGFAKQQRVGKAEAEIAVTTFLRTLVSKGMVAMAVGREAEGSGDAGGSEART